MPEHERREEVHVSVGGDKFPALRCDCDRVFLKRDAYLVHRSSCPEFQEEDEPPRRIRERRIIELSGSR